MKPISSRLSSILLFGALLAISQSAAQANLTNPYGMDAHTLHLYHFNGNTNDAVAANPVHLRLYDAASVTTDSFSSKFGTALATNRHIWASTLNRPSAATVTAADEDLPFSRFSGADGAFTIEAIIRSDCPLASQGGFIVTGENESTTAPARAYQIRINSSKLQFTQINPATVTNAFDIPTTGEHAYVEGKWFHVAVTYNGQENTDGNLKFYWTALDANANEANLIGQAKMAAEINPATSMDLTVGNSGRSATIDSVVHPTSNAAFIGVIDEVRISDIARTPADQLVPVELSGFSVE